MVEGGRIDHAAHDNDVKRTVREVVEFSKAVQVALDWRAAHPDTLIIVTADHETGGLSVLAHGSAGNYPKVSWKTTGHTGAKVPIYARGVNADRLANPMDNTAVYLLMK
jgi:alkaline phosphatase